MARVTSKILRNPHLRKELADRILRRPIQEVGLVVQRETKRRTQVVTGTLRNSWHVETRVIGGLVITRVFSNIEYAPYVENGTEFMQGAKMLAGGLDSGARWLAARGFHVEYRDE